MGWIEIFPLLPLSPRHFVTQFNSLTWTNSDIIYLSPLCKIKYFLGKGSPHTHDQLAFAAVVWRDSEAGPGGAHPYFSSLQHNLAGQALHAMVGCVLKDEGERTAGWEIYNIPETTIGAICLSIS